MAEDDAIAVMVYLKLRRVLRREYFLDPQKNQLTTRATLIRTTWILN